MKASQAEAAFFVGLAAMVTADALPPAEIPMLCATICGPIVELTSICNVHWTELKKRAVRDGTWVPNLALSQDSRSWDKREVKDHALCDEELRKRSFSVIVPAPTSFPFEVPTDDPPFDLRPTSTPTRIQPVVSESRATSIIAPPPWSPTAVLSAFTSSSSLAQSGWLARTTTTSFSPAPTTSQASWASLTGYLGEQKGQGDPHGDAEKTCVCLNKSFDVAKVAALCASCIALAGYPDNNVNIIMTECNFTSLAWTPEEDRVVDNVRVKATKPTTLSGSHVPTVNGAAGADSSNLLLATVMIGLSVGSNMML